MIKFNPRRLYSEEEFGDLYMESHMCFIENNLDLTVAFLDTLDESTEEEREKIISLLKFED